MIPALYHENFTSIKDAVASEAESVCITTDCCTSSISESYITITAHYTSKEFKLKSVLLKCANLPGSHTGAALAHIMKTLSCKSGIS